MHSDDKHKNINHSNYKFFLLQPCLRNVWQSCHGDGIDGRTVVLGHVHLREHSDVVVFERRHDEGLVPKLLAHHLHDPVRSCVSQALAEAGESQQAGHIHTWALHRQACSHFKQGKLKICRKLYLVSVGW